MASDEPGDAAAIDQTCDLTSASDIRDYWVGLCVLWHAYAGAVVKAIAGDESLLRDRHLPGTRAASANQP